MGLDWEWKLGLIKDKRLSSVQSAILAASAHNTQPWLFCTQADRIEISSDEARNLGAMDPFRREMHISIGCALQNLLLEARAQGQHPQLAIAPG